MDDRVTIAELERYSLEDFCRKETLMTCKSQLPIRDQSLVPIQMTLCRQPVRRALVRSRTAKVKRKVQGASESRRSSEGIREFVLAL